MPAIEDAVAAAGTFLIGGDLRVHRLGYGAMRLTGPGGWGEPADPAVAPALLRRAVTLGIDFIDTAEAYGPEVNERQIADALHPYPPELVIATKGGLRRTLTAGEAAPGSEIQGSAAAIRSAVEGSLRRLRVETIALYQLHRLDPRVPMAETLGALDDLRRAGKIRHIGLSEVSVAELAAARAITPIATVQNRYNLRQRRHDPVLAACEAAGIGFMPWYPLGGGPSALAGDAAVVEVAGRHGCTCSQVALAWLLARSPVMLPIPGTASIAHLDENAGAGHVRLDAGDMALLDRTEEHR
ncbi:MAG: aldo/keto reductase [Sphingomonas sp.]